MPLILGTVDFNNPLFWAVFIGWIMSVVLHEFAHGVVANWGGDYTIAERGGLSLNPFQYIDPIGSILLPAIFLVMGGVPLPGGVTYVRNDLLRSRGWQSGVALAGPTMNILLFAAGAIALHPAVGWVPTPTASGIKDNFAMWTNAHKVVAALTVLQLYSAFLNLIPMPPLDGFNMLAPFMKEESRQKLTTPPLSTALMFVCFIILYNRNVGRFFLTLVQKTLHSIGFDDMQIVLIGRAFEQTLWGR
jgi:Zn-dependent protease